MTLIKNKIARVPVFGTAEKVVAADIVERGRGGETADVAAKAIIVVVRTHHHRQCVPTNKGTNASLHEKIARHGLLFGGADGVPERGGDCRWQSHAGIDGVLRELE